jgi:hypothetical protein
MKIDKLTEGADIVRFIRAQRIYKPTRMLLDGNLWELDQWEDQDSDGKRMSWKILKS